MKTLAEVAAEFRCSGEKISDVAKAIGVGMNLRGSAGWRFAEEDVAAIREAMRPKPASTPVRRRRRRAS